MEKPAFRIISSILKMPGGDPVAFIIEPEKCEIDGIENIGDSHFGKRQIGKMEMSLAVPYFTDDEEARKITDNLFRWFDQMREAYLKRREQMRLGT